MANTPSPSRGRTNSHPCKGTSEMTAKRKPPSTSAPRTKRAEASPEQWDRFVEAARQHGCEENAVRIDEVVRRTAKLPPPRSKKPGTTG